MKNSDYQDGANPFETIGAHLEVVMSAQLKKWCAFHGLPYMSADDLLYQGKIDAVKLSQSQTEYLTLFILLWDRVMSDETSIPIVEKFEYFQRKLIQETK